MKLLNENLIVKNCPKIFSHTMELQNIQVRSIEAFNFFNRVFYFIILLKKQLSKDLVEEAENRKISNFELSEILEQKKKKKEKKQLNVS